MSINLVTYANQTVTPTNDAIIYERAIDQNGIFYGCNITVSGNNVNITGGYGIVCGREFVIESESIPVTLAPSVPLDGRLYVRLDLADADNPIQLLTAQGGTLPALEQDANVNFVNGVWEMELATFTVGVSALSDVVETYEIIAGANEGYKNFICAGTTSSQSVGTSEATINLNNVVRSNGTRLRLNTSTHEVVVGSGVKFVEVTGNIFIATHGNNDIKNVYIYKNNEQICTTVFAINNDYCMLITPTRIISVQQGDKITLRAKSGSSNMTVSSAETELQVSVC